MTFFSVSTFRLKMKKIFSIRIENPKNETNIELSFITFLVKVIIFEFSRYNGIVSLYDWPLEISAFKV